jgi:8-amino-7-oxononanoate synthase
MKFPNKLQKKLHSREENKALRSLRVQSELIDFSSNDYLGFSKSEVIFDEAHQVLIERGLKINGATGSRLLSGNYALYKEVENQISKTHQVEKALVFNSGYDANIGFFASVPQRGDIILYDELIHASIRDGIQLSKAKSYKFKHNNVEDLEKKIIFIKENSEIEEEIYVVTESVFSMDGDSPDLVKMVSRCLEHDVYLVVDEAHAIGVFNTGLIEKLNLASQVFARIITFGKALGCHGAAILGSDKLEQYLINFARSFVYTTALSPHSLATIKVAYHKLLEHESSKKLQENIQFFKEEVTRLDLNFIDSNSAIHCCIICGNEKVKEVADKFQQKGFDIKPILSPTVPEGQERLRICLHSYNTREEITEVLNLLSIFVA